jgi:hypothetical protein
MKQKKEMNKICNCDIFTHFEFYHDQRPIITCKENGKNYTYKNKSLDKITKYRVDGNLIKEEGKKCDFLLLNCKKKKAYFIELKGSDLYQAIDQITATIDRLKIQQYDFTSINARIVSTRDNTHRLKNDTKYLTFKNKIEQLNGNIIRKNIILEDINN